MIWDRPGRGSQQSAVAGKGARPPVGQLDYLLASRAGGYWRLADGMIHQMQRP